MATHTTKLRVRLLILGALTVLAACSDSPTVANNFPTAVLELRSTQPSYMAGSTIEVAVRNIGSFTTTYGACVDAVDAQVGKSWQPALTFTAERECDAVLYQIAGGSTGRSILVPIPNTAAAGVYRLRLTNVSALSGPDAPRTSAVSNTFTVTRQ